MVPGNYTLFRPSFCDIYLLTCKGYIPVTNIAYCSIIDSVGHQQVFKNEQCIAKLGAL